MKKFLFPILSPMLILSLSACAGKKNETSNDSKKPAAPAADAKLQVIPQTDAEKAAAAKKAEANGQGQKADAASTTPDSGGNAYGISLFDQPIEPLKSKAGSKPQVRSAPTVNRDETSVSVDALVENQQISTSSQGMQSAPVAGPSQNSSTATAEHEIKAEAIPWEAPEMEEGGVGQSFMHFTLDPLLKFLKTSGPPGRQWPHGVRVTLAIGYIDGYHKEALKHNGVDYGRNAAIDPFFRSTIHEILTKPCEGKLQLCGFIDASVNEVETIYSREIGYGDHEEIRVISGALTPNYVQNVVERREEQAERLTKTVEAFKNSVRDSDLVVYVGHSREGGGPDFAPPRLLKNGEVDYPYYRAHQEGAHRLISAISAPGRKAHDLAVVSCDSTAHFLGGIRKAAPDMEIVTAHGIIDAKDLLAGGLATTDLFLRNRRLSEIPSFVKGMPSLARSLQLIPPGKKAQR